MIACAGLVKAGDPDRFSCVMTALVDVRGPLFTLYALNLEAAKAPWVTEEAMIAEMRLQWWRDVVEEIAAGKPARAHEVAGPLAEVMAKHDLVKLLDAMIGARRWDIYKEPFEDADHLNEYLDQTSGHLMWAAALISGADKQLETAVRDVAYGLGVANWLQAVPAYVDKGRVPLLDGRDEGVRDLAQAGLDRLNKAKATNFGAALPAVRTAWQAKAILRQVVSDPARVAEGSLGQSEFAKRGSLVLKAFTKRW
jgi:phytoene/squalene synthetase